MHKVILPAHVVVLLCIAGLAHGQSSSSVQIDSRSIPATLTFSSSPLNPSGALVAFVNSEDHKLISSKEGNVAKWVLNSKAATEWLSRSPFGPKYVESASHLAGTRIGSQSRADDLPLNKDQVRRYYEAQFPHLRPDQITRMTDLYTQVDRKVADWRKTIRDIKVADNIALEFATAADDIRVAQLYQEFVLGKANQREADHFLPIYEKLAQEFIDNIEVK